MRSFLAVIGMFALISAQPAGAAILFDDAIIMNLSSIDAALSDMLIESLDFDSHASRMAVNGTDMDGNGVLTPGDEIVLVGHQKVTGANDSVDAIDEGQAKSFEITTVMRDWTGEAGLQEIDLFGGVKSVNAALFFDQGSATGLVVGAQPASGTGLLDVYIDAIGDESLDDFDATDINTSANGEWVATFMIHGTPDFSLILYDGGSPFDFYQSTTIQLQLVAQRGAGTGNPLDDFFVMPGVDSSDTDLGLTGSDVFLMTEIGSQDDPVKPLANPSFAGITGGTVDGNPLPNIGDNYSPSSSGSISAIPLDLELQADGNSQFAIIPEPATVLIWAGLGLVFGLGMAFRRRRN